MNVPKSMRVGAAATAAVLVGLLIFSVMSLGANAARVRNNLRGPEHAGRTVRLGSPLAQRAITSDSAVDWNIASYATSAGTCLVVVGELNGVEEGRVGGCGDRGSSVFNWSVGGLDVGGQWYNLAYGQVDAGASAVRVTLADGSTIADTSPSSGLWLVATPAQPLDNGADIVHVAAVGLDGATIADGAPSSVVAAREAALAAQQG